MCILQTPEEYWRSEALDLLVERFGRSERAPEASPHSNGRAAEALAPDIPDLVRLHRLIRERMATTVLEFGVGFSTVVMADALAKNQMDYEALPRPPSLRNCHAFRLFSIDANRHWIAETRRRLPPHLSERVEISYSRVLAGTFNGRLCHRFERLPNVVPDFVYLDGPAPRDVEGSVNGLDFSIDERTVMSADLLLMESTLLPRTFIVVDGRTNNARFLRCNFQRRFVCHEDAAADVTTFELDEPPLGRASVDLASLVAANRKGLPASSGRQLPPSINRSGASRSSAVHF